EEDFVGSAHRPSLASVVPKLGLVREDDGISFESDTVEFYFSKSMREEALNSSNIIITGGSLQSRTALWVNSQMASVEVIQMQTISYNAQAINLYDFAGNPIY